MITASNKKLETSLNNTVHEEPSVASPQIENNGGKYIKTYFIDKGLAEGQSQPIKEVKSSSGKSDQHKKSGALCLQPIEAMLLAKLNCSYDDLLKKETESTLKIIT